MTILDGGPAIDLGPRIRIARVNAHLDQLQLGQAVGVARNSISNWETGRSEPSASAFVRLARVLGVSLDWLAAGVHDDGPASGASGAIVRVARPEGFEPPTFCFVAVYALLRDALRAVSS